MFLPRRQTVMASPTDTEAEALQKVGLHPPRDTFPHFYQDLVVNLTNALPAFQKLRSALWFQIGNLVDEESINLGVNATPQFIGSLMELVWAQIGM